MQVEKGHATTQAETRGTVLSSVLETPTFVLKLSHNQPNVLNACPDILDNQPFEEAAINYDPWAVDEHVHHAPVMLHHSTFE